MTNMARVTVSLPRDLVDRIDEADDNRSRFLAEAARRELQRLRRKALRESLDHPHPDGPALAAEGVAAWLGGLPEEPSSLVDASAGRAVRWVPGVGWTEGEP